MFLAYDATAVHSIGIINSLSLVSIQHITPFGGPGGGGLGGVPELTSSYDAPDDGASGGFPIVT